MVQFFPFNTRAESLTPLQEKEVAALSFQLHAIQNLFNSLKRGLLNKVFFPAHAQVPDTAVSFDGISYSIPATTTASFIPPIPPRAVSLPTQSRRTIALTQALFKGSRHPEVKLLQDFLIAEGFLAPNNNTGFFGQLTEAAVKVYQCKMAIICVGTFTTSGWGVVGPKTRARLIQGK